MKDRRQIITGIMAAVGFLLLILDGQTAFQGALDGIELCIRTVIPSLFPFFIISMLLTSSLAGMNSNLLRPLGKILRIPSGSEGIFLIGLLSGYPTGAQSIATAHKNGQLSTRDAHRMMGFCSNAGPAFLFGMIGPIFSSPIIPWILWVIHIVSAFLTGIILPGRSSDSVSVSHTQKFRIQTALERSVHTMAHVCGWIILFRVILSFLSRWLFFMLPNAVQIIISGGLELSNGCVLLKNIRDEGLRFLICSGFLGFGGLCKAEQEMMDYIATLSMSAFVLDYDHNAKDAEYLRATHEKAYRTVREKHPKLPIIMISCPRFDLPTDWAERLAVIRRTFVNAVKAGDTNVYLLNGSEFFAGIGYDYSQDGVHPNDLGFDYMARAIYPTLKKILK